MPVALDTLQQLAMITLYAYTFCVATATAAAAVVCGVTFHGRRVTGAYTAPSRAKLRPTLVLRNTRARSLFIRARTVCAGDIHNQNGHSHTLRYDTVW